MSSKVLIIQNSHEGPGIITQVLAEKQILFDLVKLDSGAPIPAPEFYRATFVLGGPDSANDQTPKILSELAAIGNAMDKGAAVFGICLGCQILVKLAGGKVLPGITPEVGLKDQNGNPFRVQLTDAGKQDPLFAGIEHSFRVFELHGEIIELTPSIQLLGEGSFVKDQIVKINDVCYGTLCHYEIISEEVANWFDVDSMIASLDREELMTEFNSIRGEYYRNGRKLLENYLRIVGL